MSRRFGALNAVVDVSFKVAQGERRVILGPNGAGKTTLFNLVCGDYAPSSGTLSFFGRDITKLKPHQRARIGIGRTYQNSLLFNGLTVLDNLYLAVRGVEKKPLLPAAAQTLAIRTLRLRATSRSACVSATGSHSAVEDLSHGQRRQLEVGMALASEPKLLMLDEPAAGLSPGDRPELLRLLRELPRTLDAHPHRARHGYRAARGRHRDADEGRQDDRGEIARQGRARSGRPGHLSRGSCLMLSIRDLGVNFGHAEILRGVSLDVGAEPFAIAGRNGMGKTTLCSAIMGLVPVRSGSVTFEARASTAGARRGLRAAASPSSRRGVAYFPRFPSTSTCASSAKGRNAVWTIERVYDTFPRLAERKKNGGAQLSGGEQQMLAISRALLLNPKLIIMDEPSEGLAPALVDHLIEVLRGLAQEKMGLLLVEQNLRVATSVASNVAIMLGGQITATVSAAELNADEGLQRRYLGVSTGSHSRAEARTS